MLEMSVTCCSQSATRIKQFIGIAPLPHHQPANQVMEMNIHDFPPLLKP